jgi:Cu-processing system ATP-binding protein
MIGYLAFTKDYGRQRAVDALSLEVAAGTVVALLGPNGSGKTTSIKAAAGLVFPTSGEVLLGEDRRPARDPEARRRLAFLPQRVSFPDTLTGREVVEFYRRLRGADADATSRALKFASLNGASGRVVSTYSGGMLQRLGLAVALLPPTDVLLLDEPTAALDPEGLSALYDLIEERRCEGTATLFSSHQLGDVERLADRLAVLVNGRLVAFLSQREVADRMADRGVMRVRLGPCGRDTVDRVRARHTDVRWDRGELVVPGPARLRPAVLDTIRAMGGEVVGLTTEEGRLDEFYRELIGSPS